MKKKKPYDAVAEVRKIRNEMSVKYWKNYDLLFADLKAASEKFQQDYQSRVTANR